MSPNAYFVNVDEGVDMYQVDGLLAVMVNHIVYLFNAPLHSWTWDPQLRHAKALGVWVYCNQTKEGMQTWYAFAHAPERKMFVDLIQFDGIGPGVALKVLSKTPWQSIETLVETKDKAGFLKLPGLTGKLGQVVAAEWFKDAPEVKSKIMPDPDAVGAMVALGMKKTEATQAVLNAMAASPGADTEQLIKLCLRKS